MALKESLQGFWLLRILGCPMFGTSALIHNVGLRLLLKLSCVQRNICVVTCL